MVDADLDESVERWLKAHGAEELLDADDVLALTGASRRVCNLMMDRQWHHADEIRLAAGKNGQPASEGLRRARDLRPAITKLGLKMEKERVAGSSRLFRYRFVPIRDRDQIFAGLTVGEILQRCGYESLDAYYASDHWQQRRQLYYQSHRMECFISGRRDSVALHHITYCRLTQERDEDLVPLCAYWHEKVHEMIKQHGLALQTAHLICRDIYLASQESTMITPGQNVMVTESGQFKMF